MKYDTMLAARLDPAAKTFGIERIPIPEPGESEVRIAVKAAGVCLSDLHLIDGTLPLNGGTVTLGHEVAGVIQALGAGVSENFVVGQRVVLQAGQICLQCANCTRRRTPCLQSSTRGVHYDGGWAEYALARQDTVVPIPDDLPFEQAAIIPDAVSTPYASIVTTAGVRPAQAVGVWGIGGLGAHAVQILRMVGAAPIIAVDPLLAARDRALEFGADLAIDPAAPDLPERIQAATSGRGLDFAFDFAGAIPAREQAEAALSRGGALVLVGLVPAPITIANSLAFSTQRHRLVGHYGSGSDAVEQLVDLARHHRLDLEQSITRRFPLADAGYAVDQLASKAGNPVRLVLIP
jgi:D-arabinose 1-dehydrogenase-like Zn-dependent alcohol dehydrogenase